MNPLYAAALQDHITNKYAFHPSKSKASGLSLRQKQLLRWSKSMKSEHLAMKKNAPLEFTEKYLDAVPSTLAQRLGVIPHDTISPIEWIAIKKKAFKSLYTPSQRINIHAHLDCPICQEGFANSTQIILSCSHVFHDTCFKSWERLQPLKTCPMCRRQNYQRLLSREGHFHALTRAAILIQSLWRGWIAWKRFQPIWSAHQPKDVNVRKRKLLKKLEKGSLPNLTFTTSRQSNSLVTLFDHLDLINSNSKKIINGGVETFEKEKKKKSGSEWSRFWEGVYQKACRRGDEDCPICLHKISISILSRTHQDGLTRNQRKTTMLGCSHYMHSNCFESYQRLMNGHSCPICRIEISKSKKF